MMVVNFLALIAGAISVALGLTVIAEGTNTKSMRITYGMFAGGVGLWAIALGLFLVLPPNPSTDPVVVLSYVIGVLIPYAFLLFSFEYLSIPVSLKVRLFAFIPCIAMSVLAIVPGAMIGTIDAGPAKMVELVFSTYFIYSSLFIVYVVIGLVLLIANAARAKGALIHRRAAAVTLSIGFAGGGLFDIILPLLGNYRLIAYGPLFAFVTSAGVFYLIARHGLFDIRRAVVRTAAYVLSLASLAAIYLLITYFVFDGVLDNKTGFGQALVNVSLTLLLAFLFQPTKRFFDRVTNKLFFKNDYNVEEFFARLTKRLSIITDLNVLLQYSSSEIRNTLKASFGAFYIYQIDKPSVYVATDKRKKLPKDDAEMLDAYVTDNRKDILITDQLTDTRDKDLKRMLESHRIALVLPIIKDNIISGYMFLGEHLSSHYKARDMRALLTIAGELTIAIQNALSVQQVRDINETLQQRVNEATKELRASNAQLRRLDEAKDEFVSMASHQLRTPLTSIKGYISMVREGDVGKISEPQDQMLGQAFASSERMVHLINDFLNVSRLQTGKFMIDKRPVNLAKVIEQELDSLVTNAKSRNLEFTYTPPKHFPTLNLDEDKMRQVIMNFSDNAIYYSAEGTKIKVKLAVEGKDAIFTVTDTGIGVPRSEQSQLFNKFYRASNARRQRPDGTGVGLFLAKKVIDAHGGQVVFESVEGKGSTFGFRLPIDQLATAGDADDLDDQDNNN